MQESSSKIIQNWLAIYIPFFTSIIMMCAMGARYWQLKGSAKHYQSRINSTIKMRVFLILFVICDLFGISFLTIYDDDFEYYRSKDSSVYLFEITVMTIQIGCLFLEFSKNVPIMWPHKAYWVLQTIIDFVLVSILGTSEALNLQVANNEFILEAIHFFSLLLLTVYSLFYRKQDIYQFENIGIFTLQVPEITSNGSTIPFLPYIPVAEEASQIMVLLDKVFTIRIDAKGQQELTIKLRVFLQKQKEYKMTKKLQDFLDLETQLLEIAASHPSNPYPFRMPNDSNKTSFSGSAQLESMVTKVNSLQYYMNTLTSKPDYFFAPLLEFLNVPDNIKLNLERERIRAFERQQSNSMYADNFLDSSNSKFNQDEDNHNVFDRKSVRAQLIEESDEESKEIEISQQSALKSTDENLNFFDVVILSENEIKNHIEYDIQLKVLKNNQKWTIRKRFRQFNELNDVLKHNLKLQKMPPLPKKKFKMNMDEKEKQLRKQGIENYLKIILNERMYFIKQLFDFIQIDASVLDYLRQSNVGSDIEKFSNFQVYSQGHLELIEGKNQYTVYRFQFKVPYVSRDGESYLVDQGEILQKRYTDFAQLHEALKVHFQETKEVLPDLPPKYTSFGTHTTVASRVIGFQSYLESLLKIHNILECVQFKIFIGWQSFNILQPFLNQDYDIQSIMIPETNEQRTTSDLIGSLTRKDLFDQLRLDDLQSQYQRHVSPNENASWFQSK